MEERLFSRWRAPSVTGPRLSLAASQAGASLLSRTQAPAFPAPILLEKAEELEDDDEGGHAEDRRG